MLTHRRGTTTLPPDLAARVQAQTRDIAMLSLTLSLLQAACSMSLEGVTRASVSEVTARAEGDSGVQVTPSVAGQVFSSIGVRTVTSHGRNRLVLSMEELLPLRDKLAEDWELRAPQAEEYLSGFGKLAEYVAELDAKRQRVLNLIAREKANREFLKGRDRWMFQARYVESEAQKLKQTIERCEALRKSGEAMKKEIKALPRLEKREAELEARLARYQQEDHDLSMQEEKLREQEEKLGDRLVDLKNRRQYIRADKLEQAIEEAHHQLESLNEQLGEKRSRLARLLGKGGASP